ncbi:MAG: tRNA (adenosine(37)-N6)-dimethylallyltransferase MiaA [Sedimentisphaerales bacterium]|nr:tRNA (adenosine(37)-N6)-dimethylallyltransferase MiaA [Sedimentisphaerales bacterium]
MILITGVTASGKGSLAFDLAQTLDAEIISIDSMKVYRRMNVGTAKPPEEIRRQIRYHLIDIIEPSDSFSVGAFLKAAADAVEQINSRGKKIVAVGGTAMYIKALLHGLFEGPGTDLRIRERLKEQAQAHGLAPLHDRLKEIDPEAAYRIHPNDAKRIIRALEVYQITGRGISELQQQWTQDRKIEQRAAKQNWTIIGLRRDKDDQNKRINARAKKMIEAGLLDEVEALLAEEKPLSTQARCAIGYAEMIEHLTGRIDLDQTLELIKKNTRRLAKGQRTWFKTFDNVNWLDIKPQHTPQEILNRTETLLKNLP